MSLSEDRKDIKISRPLYDRLIELKDLRQQELKRQVSFSEVIEGLLAGRKPVQP